MQSGGMMDAPQFKVGHDKSGHPSFPIFMSPQLSLGQRRSEHLSLLKSIELQSTVGHSSFSQIQPIVN